MKRIRSAGLVSLTAGVLSCATLAPAAHAVVDNHISLVSVASPEVSGNGSYTRAVSNNGRFVVFASAQPNVVPGDPADPNGRFLYLRDLKTGTTTRLSHGTGGFLMSNAAISGNGQYVAFASQDGNELSSLRLYHRATGITTVISKPPAGTGQWYTVSLSDDGHYVDYTRTAPTADETTNVTHMYRYNIKSGATTRPVKGKLGGTFSNPDQATIPSSSADGRYLTFVRATDPAAVLSPYRLIRLDTKTGAKVVIGTSAAWNIPQNGFGDPSMSNNGRFIAYWMVDPASLVSSYVYDAKTGTSELVTHNASGDKANAGAGQAQISGDGRYVTFSSSATDIVAGVPGVSTIYVYDRRTGTAQAIVKNRQGVYPGGAGAISSLPYIDGHGDTVAFTTQAQNLSAGANNRLERAYAWQRP